MKIGIEEGIISIPSSTLTNKSIILPVRIQNSTEYVNFIIDEEDYSSIEKYKWSRDKKGYAVAWPKVKTKIKLHRFIMGLNSNDTYVVDHIDRNTYNNIKSNLRVLSSSENAQNRGSVRGSSSKYRNVSWNKKTNKWVVEISKGSGKNKTRYYFGAYESEDEANIVAVQARKNLMPFNNEAI